jgi:hypothetical protein
MAVKLTEAFAEKYFEASVGVKVTLWVLIPTEGIVAGVVHAKEPGMLNPDTLADPPFKFAADNGWPSIIEVAVGRTVIVGVAWVTTRLTMVVIVVYFVGSAGVKVTL